MQTNKTIKKSALAPTILIAGGAGFIGSHLAEVLLQKEARVIILDNFRTGKDLFVNHLLQNPKFALYDVDINQGLPSEIESVDYIIHLASLEEYLYSKKEMSLDSLLTNAVGTKNLLDLAARSDAKFLLASTTDVYEGMMSQLSLDAYFGKTQFQESKYSLAEAKRYAEALVWEYHKRNSVDVRIVRLPEIYGPRMNLESSGSLGSFMRDLLGGRNFVVKGDGTQKEHYVFITDAVAGVIKALLNPDTTGKIFSLVVEDATTVLETAFLVRSLADRQVEIKFEDKGLFKDTREFTPDTYSLKALDWKPKVNFKDGVISTLTWFGYKVNQHAFKSAHLIDETLYAKTPTFPEANNTMPASQQVPDAAQIHRPDPPPPQYSEAQRIVHPAQSEAIAANFAVQDPYAHQTPPVIKQEAGETEQPQYPPGIMPGDERAAEFELKGEEPPENTVPEPKKGFSVKSMFAWIPRPNLEVPHISVASKISLFVVVVFSFLAVFIALPLAQTYSASKKAMENLQAVPEYVAQFDSEQAANSANIAFQEFQKANKYFSSLAWLYNVFGQTERYEATSKFLNSVTYFSRVAYDVSMSAEPYKSIWESLKPDSNLQFDPNALNQTKLHMSDAKNNLQLAIADFSEVDVTLLPAFAQEGTVLYEDVLATTSEGLDLAWAVTSDLPDLLGFDESKKYLILFQNNNEIRPTGGFIGSYAFLYLNKGKIEELGIDDIYNPDGQIDVRNIRVTPPGPIGEFLLEDRLYIRNANWDPDFPRSAETIKDLFFRLNGEDIDGVIAVDLKLVQDLLDVTGPIYLAAYNEDVSSENLYERTQFHASFDYEDGSPQKRQFLTVLGSKLLESLFGLEKDKTPALMAVLGSSLDQRHMQMHLFSSPLNAELIDRKWSGNLIRTNGDYLQVVNANLGGTKANYYVKNEMDYKITSKTRDGLLRAELTLTYNHTGIDESWPGGPYTNYLRVLTGEGSKLTGAKVIRNLSIEEDIFEDIVISEVNPYTSFETDFVLDPASTIKIVLTYDLPQQLSLTKLNQNYSLIWQKQAGTHSDKFNYSIAAPFGMELVAVSDNLDLAENTAFTSGRLNEDLEVFVELQ